MIDGMLLAEIGLGILVFIIIIRILFGVSSKDNQFQRNQEQVHKDIKRLREEIRRLRQKIPPKEYGEMMDDLMEEYYKAK